MATLLAVYIVFACTSPSSSVFVSAFVPKQRCFSQPRTQDVKSLQQHFVLQNPFPYDEAYNPIFSDLEVPPIPPSINEKEVLEDDDTGSSLPAMLGVGMGMIMLLVAATSFSGSDMGNSASSATRTSPAASIERAAPATRSTSTEYYGDMSGTWSDQSQWYFY